MFHCRSDLIDRDIERAVALMQSVIELGRYIRDIKVIPVKVSDSDVINNDVINNDVINNDVIL